MPQRDETNGPYLAIKKVCHNFGDTMALRFVSLEVKKDQILALVGPSGSGKSTLLAAIAGMINPSAGAIDIGGSDVLALPPEARGLGMVFQDYALWPHMTVLQNVAFPLRRAGKLGVTEIATRVASALKRVGLAGLESRRPHELSGGQQQRVALARAVIREPRLLLLDEPLSALDPATRIQVRSELSVLLRALNVTTVIVTHDREEAFELADEVAVLLDGQLQQCGSPRQVYEQPVNMAVAKFMGTNLIPVYVLPGSRAHFVGFSGQIALNGSHDEGPGYLTIAPEQARIVTGPSSTDNVFAGEVVRVQYRGGEYRVQLMLGRSPNVVIEARASSQPQDAAVNVHFPRDSVHVIRKDHHECTTTH